MKQSSDQYDVIVIGGGIYGLMIALEASLRGQSVALIERHDWGYATTSSWLRILHGGLRYLQSADLSRFFESVNERKWFLQHFPEYIEPLSCVMPLYERHSHSSPVMRALSFSRLMVSLGHTGMQRPQPIHLSSLMTVVTVRSFFIYVSLINDSSLHTSVLTQIHVLRKI